MMVEIPSVAGIVDRARIIDSMVASSSFTRAECGLITDMAIKAVDDARERMHAGFLMMEREDMSIQCAIIGFQLLEMMCSIERNAFLQIFTEIGGKVQMQQPDGGHVDITEEIKATIPANDTTKH
jgi:hypothetical protein